MATVKKLMTFFVNGMNMDIANNAIKDTLLKATHAFVTLTSLRQAKIVFVLNGRIGFA